jgi:heme/copper-type cytochrome/quinol oxidase subunit 2
MALSALLLAASTTAPATRPANADLARNAWVLFLTITALLVLFVVVVGLTALSRARRAARREAAIPTSTVDPWQESANRPIPYEDSPGGTQDFNGETRE